MPQYQVPQFIDIQDKVFGPLTIKQFLFVGVSAIPAILMYQFFEMWLVVILGGPIILFGLALALYKPSGVPFPILVLGALRYAIAPKLYLWKKEDTRNKPADMPAMEMPMNTTVNKLSPSKLQDLAWSLDIQHKPVRNP